METTEKTTITVEAAVNAPVKRVWYFWTTPKHITQWNFATDEWHCPTAENDLKPGGRLSWRMEAKDGSAGFDFEGTYDNIQPNELIEYTIADGRKVNVAFIGTGDETKLVETFEAENMNSVEMQKDGWQAILDNFKKYIEAWVEMVKVHYEILIDAPVEKVYQTMLDPKGFEEWTAEFNPTSYYEGSWEKGATIRFISTDENGNRAGMVSRIKENTPNEFVSIEHLGIINGDREIFDDPEMEGWTGALENYTFSEQAGKTLLSIDADSTANFKAYFEETWPKALNKLKRMCEG